MTGSPTKIGFASRLARFSALLLLCSCRCLAAEGVVDALGRAVIFDEPPRRVVLAGRGVFMTADSLYLFPEAPARVVAMERIRQGRGDFLAAIDPGFGGKILLPSESGPEQIAALRPDTVILKSYMREKLGSALETLGVKVVYLDFESPSRFMLDIEALGGVFHSRGRASEIAAYYEGRVNRVREAVAPIAAGERPRVLMLYYSEGTGTFNVPPPEWMQTVLVEIAGGIPVWKEWAPGKGWTRVGFEQIAANDPDWVFIISYFGDAREVVERLYGDRTWSVLRAARLKRVRPFPADYHSWDQPDPRWILGLLFLAKTLHPGRLPGLDLAREARGFFREMYGLDDRRYDRALRPMIVGLTD